MWSWRQDSKNSSNFRKMNSCYSTHLSSLILCHKWNFWTTIGSPKQNFATLKCQNFTNISGVVTLNIKTITQRFYPCSAMNSCFSLWNQKKKKKSYFSQLKDWRLNSIQHIKTWNARPYIDMLGQKKSVTFLHLKQRSNELWKKKINN